MTQKIQTSQFSFSETGTISQIAAVSNEDLIDHQMITGDMFNAEDIAPTPPPAPAGWVHQFIDARGEWNTVTDDNEEPVFYPDRMAAAIDMVDHIAACEDAVKRGDMDDFTPEQWRIWLLG